MTLVRNKSPCKLNQIEVRSLGWALIQYDWCPHKKGVIQTERRHREIHEHHVIAKAEIEIIHLHIKKYQRFSENHQKLERGKEEFSSWLQRGYGPYRHFDPRL